MKYSFVLVLLHNFLLHQFSIQRFFDIKFKMIFVPDSCKYIKYISPRSSCREVDFYYAFTKKHNTRLFDDKFVGFFLNSFI